MSAYDTAESRAKRDADEILSLHGPISELSQLQSVASVTGNDDD